MRRFLLDLTATDFAADYFFVEVYDDRATGYIVFSPDAPGLFGGEAVVIDRYTLSDARHTWKHFAQGGVQIDPDSDAFAEALEVGFCHDGCCNHYTCTEGRSIDEWDEPEPTQWDHNSEALAMAN